MIARETSTQLREEGPTMDTEYARGVEAEQAQPIGLIEDLDRELERLERLANELAIRVIPISNQYDANRTTEVSPQPEPSSALRGRVERLRDLCGTLDRVLRDIEL